MDTGFRYSVGRSALGPAEDALCIQHAIPINRRRFHYSHLFCFPLALIRFECAISSDKCSISIFNITKLTNYGDRCAEYGGCIHHGDLICFVFPTLSQLLSRSAYRTRTGHSVFSGSVLQTKSNYRYLPCSHYGTQTTQDNYRDSNGGDGAGAGVSLCRAKRMDTYRFRYILLTTRNRLFLG